MNQVLGFTARSLNNTGRPFASRRLSLESLECRALLAADPLMLASVEVQNSPPAANPDFYIIDDDDLLITDDVTGVLINDVDPDDDSLQISQVVEPPTRGSLTIEEDGGFTYRPQAIGIDTFVYEVSDPTGATDTEAVTIIINRSAGTPPLAEDDQYSFVEGSRIFIRAASGVLANDVGQSTGFEAVPILFPSNGELDLKTDGAFTYIARPGFIGTDQFRYRLNENGIDLGEATVTIEVKSAGETPTIMGLLARDQNNNGLFDPEEVVEGAIVQLFVDDGDGVFDPVSGDLEAVQPVITELGGYYGFSALNPNKGYFVVQPTQQVEGLVLPSQVSRLIEPGAHDLLFDSFESTQTVTAQPPAPVQDASARSFVTGETEVIGGERDLFVALEAGEGSLLLAANRGDFNGALHYQSEANSQGFARVTWDGEDNDPVGVGNGLDGRDLTLNATQKGIAFWAGAGTTGGMIEIRLLEEENSSVAERPISFEGLRYQFVPFHEFFGEADPSQVDAIELLIETDAPGGDAIEFDSFGTAGPKIVDLFSTETVAEVSVSTTNGVEAVYVGDDVSYTVVVSNDGPNDLKAASFLHDVPIGLTDVTYSSAIQGAVTGNAESGVGGISDSLNLAAGSSVTYHLMGTVTASAMGQLVSEARLLLPDGISDSDLSNNTATDVDEVIREVDVSVVKINGQDFATPGDVIDYTIFVTNRGPADVRQVSINDEMPEALVNVLYTSEASRGVEGNTLQGSGDIRDLVNIPKGGNVTYLVTATVRQEARGELLNVVSAQTTDNVIELNPVNNVATHRDVLFPTSDLAVSISTTQTEFVPGEEVAFVVEVQNVGPTDAESATILDAFSSQFVDVTYASFATLGATGNTEIGFDSIDDFVFMPAGSTIRYEVQATIAADAAGVLLNDVSVIPGVEVIDPNPANNHAQLEGPLMPVSDLLVEIDDGVDTTRLGETLTYVIVVENQGPSDIGGVRVFDSLPPQLEQVSYVTDTTGEVEGNSDNGSGPIDEVVSMAVGSSLTYTVSAVVASSGSLRYEVEVELPESHQDPSLGNNIAFDLTEVVLPDRADLSVDVMAEPIEVVAGQAADYRMMVTVANAGPNPARLVRVDGQWPAELEMGLPAVPQGGLASTAEGYRWEVESLSAGASLTLELPYTVAPSTAPQVLVHRVLGVTDSIDRDLENNQAEATVEIQAVADLRMAIDDGVSEVIAGDAGPLTYQVNVQNAGPSRARGIETEINLPAQYLVGDLVPSSGSIDQFGNQLVWRIDSLDAEEAVELVIRYDVADDVIAGLYQVEATVGSDTTDSDSSNNLAVDVNQVRSVVDLTVAIDDGVREIIAGLSEQYTFEVVVANRGPSIARELLITDRLPADYSIIEITPATGEVVESIDGFEWRVEQLGVDEEISLSGTYTVAFDAEGGEKTNVVRVSSAGEEANEADNVAEDKNLIQVSSIRGTVWNDGNGNGARETNEMPIQDWFVFSDANQNGVHDPGEASAVADLQGEYEFAVTPGLHHVTQAALDGWETTSPARFATAAAFESRRDAEVVDLATDLTTADFNQDGRSDLAILNEYSNRLVVYSRSEQGVFEETFSLTVGVRPRSLTVVDFDKDGDLDLALTTLGGRQSGPVRDHGVTILSNNGNGQFANYQTIRAGNGPQDVVALDADLDGDFDLAVANVHAGTLTLLANRNNRFVFDRTVEVGHSPTSVSVGDLNQDGLTDLIVSNFGSDSVEILINRGGRFISRQEISVGDGPAGVTSLDVDHDGDVDLAVANFLGDDVSILINDGNGEFDAGSKLFLDRGARPLSLVANDLNADGEVDLLISNAELGKTDLALGVGGGSFSTGPRIETGLGPQALTLLELDDDDTATDGMVDFATVLVDVDTATAGLAGGVAVLENRPNRVQLVEVAAGETKQDVDFGNLQYRVVPPVTHSRTLSSVVPEGRSWQRAPRQLLSSSSGRQAAFAKLRQDLTPTRPNRQHRMQRQRRFLEQKRLAAVDQALGALIDDDRFGSVVDQLLGDGEV